MLKSTMFKTIVSYQQPFLLLNQFKQRNSTFQTRQRQEETTTFTSRSFVELQAHLKLLSTEDSLLSHH